MNHQANLITLLQKLVQTPSVNGVHPEAAVAEVVAQFAQAQGLGVEVVARDAARPNVLVRLGPPGEVGLLLVAHTDTVAPGDEAAWAHPPFAGVIQDGRLYGRGAVDKVEFGVALTRRALLNVTTTDGQPLPRGAAVSTDDGEFVTLVQEGSQVFLPDVLDRRPLWISAPGQPRCRLHFDLPEKGDPEVYYETAPARCQP